MTSRSNRSGDLLREVARLYTRAQRVVSECCRTTNTQCHLLGELARSGPMPLSELGARVMLEKSWVSRAVDTMVDRGLVTKEPNPGDARSLLVSLTREGRRTADELETTLTSHAEHLLGSLTPAEQASVEASLGLLIKALREDTAAMCCMPAPNGKDHHVAQQRELHAAPGSRR